MLHVASVAVFDRKDRLLFGLRRDSWKWNLPGGCVEKGEDHLDAAQRELNEETGILVPKHKLEYLGSETVRAPDLDREITVHSYRVQIGIDQIPTTKNDPDKECVCWKWVDVSNGIPEPFAKRLHNKRDVTLRFLGLQGNGKELRKYDQNEIGVLARELDDVDFSSPSEQPKSRKEMSSDDKIAFIRARSTRAKDILPFFFDSDPAVRVAAIKPFIDARKNSNIWHERSPWRLSPEWLNAAVSGLDPDQHAELLAQLLEAQSASIDDKVFDKVKDKVNFDWGVLSNSRHLSEQKIKNEILPKIVDRAINGLQTIYKSLQTIYNPRDRNLLSYFSRESQDAREDARAAVDALAQWGGHPALTSDMVERFLKGVSDVSDRFTGLDLSIEWTLDKFFAGVLKHPTDGARNAELIWNAGFKFRNASKKVVQELFPDYTHEEKVGVKAPFGTKKFGLNALRKLRDFIDSQGGRIHKSALEKLGRHPGQVLHQFQDAQGYISSQAIQEFIDSVEEIKWNVSHARWTGVQRHSDEPSRVFQLNISNEHIRKLKEAGVYDTFLRALREATNPQHPVTPTTVGWVRYTQRKNPYFLREIDERFDEIRDKWVDAMVQKNPKASRKRLINQFEKKVGRPSQESWLNGLLDARDRVTAIKQLYEEAGLEFPYDPDEVTPESAKLVPGIFIDEVQSDLGQFITRQTAKNKTLKRGSKKYPQKHLDKISEIIFGSRHANEVLYDAFLQYMRDKGNVGMKVAVHTPETKAPLAGMNTSRPLPVHMKVTYGEIPQRFGFEPSKYGTLATHTNKKLFDKPTWEDEIRKKEEELAKMAFDPQHLSAIRRDSVEKGRKIIASPEIHQIPEPVLPYRQLFEERLRNSPEVAQPRWKSPGGIGTKVVYDVDNQPFLLKPYHEDPMDIGYARVPMYGWAELTSQDMYHAGGIGDLHQKVFLTDYDVDGERVPMIAIAMDPDMREVDDLIENKDPLGDPQKDHPRLRKDVAKIAFMDFLTGNLDRHGSNLMWGYKDGVPKLLSIDHGRSFQYLMGAGERWGTHHDPDKLNRDYLWHYNVGTRGYWPLHDIIGESWDDEALEDAVRWWTANREKIVGAFARNLKAVKSPVLRYHLARNLRDRKKLLDRFAEDWQTSGRAAAAYLPPNDEGEDLDDIQSVKLYPFYWWKV